MRKAKNPAQLKALLEQLWADNKVRSMNTPTRWTHGPYGYQAKDGYLDLFFTPGLKKDYRNYRQRKKRLHK